MNNNAAPSSPSAVVGFEVAPLISLTSDLWDQPLLLEKEKQQTNSNTTSDSNHEQEEPHQQRENIGQQVVKALQTSGFLLIQSDLMPTKLQRQALEDATKWLTSTQQQQQQQQQDKDNSTTTTTASAPPEVVKHPTDPKTYVMLEPKHFSKTTMREEGEEEEEEGKQQQQQQQQQTGITQSLRDYWEACETLKRCVLRAIGIGLQFHHPEDLVTWHNQGNHSAMRLLYYPPANNADAKANATTTTGNRCKEHSDYGTVTLLSTDGISGLEIFIQGKWYPIPHVAGSMVVNIGSLLSEWTNKSKATAAAATTTLSDPPNNKEAVTAEVDDETSSSSPRIPQRPLLATLHRVAGPDSVNSTSDPKILQEAIQHGRTSIAFFADPDDGTPLSSSSTTMEEYITWRSGGNNNNAERSGVAFTSGEREMLDQYNKPNHHK